MSDHLRHALIRARLQPVDVAAALAVDPKTVDRWIKGRIPFPRHREAVAELLNLDERDLWPDLITARRMTAPDIHAVYPHRWAVPHAVWRHLFESAREQIDVLTYSGLFLADDAGLLRIIADRARAGVTVRILVGDPDSPNVAARGTEEGIGPDIMAARIRNALTLYRPLQAVDGVELRLHETVLYNSIYRADDDLLVNTHAYGAPAAQAPVIHVRRTTPDEGTAAIYLTSLERVWSAATPAPTEGEPSPEP